MAKNNLSFLYNNLEVEFAFCAYGKQTSELLWVERVELPRIIYASPEMVFYGGCYGKNFLGYGHSHPPPNACGLSDVDVNNFLIGAGKDTKYAFLICPGDFAAYSRSEVAGHLGKSLTTKPAAHTAATARR